MSIRGAHFPEQLRLRRLIMLRIGLDLIVWVRTCEPPYIYGINWRWILKFEGGK